jgi:hypothetical protein
LVMVSRFWWCQKRWSGWIWWSPYLIMQTCASVELYWSESLRDDSLVIN